MTFYYIRHGFPTYHPDALTDLGQRQAEAVSRRFTTYGLDRLFTSSAGRAMQTAQPTCEVLGLEPTILDWADEKYACEEFYVFDKRKGKGFWIFLIPEYIDLLASRQMADLGDRWYDHPALAEYRENFVRSTERVSAESDKFFASLGFEHDRERRAYRVTRKNDERVAMFAHQGFGKIFLSCLLDIPYPTVATRMDMDFTGVTVIDFPTDGEYAVPQILQLSDTRHLAEAGLMTGYQNGKRI